jgi:hypothetical protein
VHIVAVAVDLVIQVELVMMVVLVVVVRLKHLQVVQH